MKKPKKDAKRKLMYSFERFFFDSFRFLHNTHICKHAHDRLLSFPNAFRRSVRRRLAAFSVFTSPYSAAIPSPPANPRPIVSITR